MRTIYIAALIITGCGGQTSTLLNATPDFIVTDAGTITDAFPDSALELIQPVQNCVSPDINDASYTLHNITYADAMAPFTFSADAAIPRISERTASILVPDIDAGLLPTVIEIHGGAWFQGGVIESDIQQLATNGYVSIGLNYRLVASNDGGVPTSMNNLENSYPASISDVRCALRFIKRHAAEYNIDITKLALLAGSAGGQLAALLASSDKAFDSKFDDGTCPLTTNLPDIRLAVINYGGNFDFLDIEAGVDAGADAGYQPAAAMLGYYPPQDAPNARVASPTSHISSKTPPTLLMFGSNDTTFPSSNSTNYYNALREAGVRSTLIEVVGLAHAYPMIVSSSQFDGGIDVPTCTALAAFKQEL